MVDREGVIMCPNDVNMFGVPSKFHNYRTQGRYLTLQDLNFDPIFSYKTGANNGATCGGKASVTATPFSIAANMSDAQRNYQHPWIPTTNSNEIWTGCAAPDCIR
jgi:hypothetical protein